MRLQKLACLLDEFGLSGDENLQILASFPGLTTLRVSEFDRSDAAAVQAQAISPHYIHTCASCAR